MNNEQQSFEVCLHLWIDDKLWRDLKTTDVFGHIAVRKKTLALLELFYKTNRKFITLIGNERSQRFRVPDKHDMHLWMPIEIYRWLKDSHAGQNVHGMAQIVRAIVCYYVELVRNYGQKEAFRIFTGSTDYRMKRAFVRFRRSLFALLGISKSEIKHQLDTLSCLEYKFIKGFVVIMQ